MERKQERCCSEKATEAVYLEAFKFYGVEAQAMVACEECGELIQAISKINRKYNKENRMQLAEEIADVRIVCSQLMLRYGISDEEIRNIEKRKVRRLSDRLWRSR